VPGSAVSTDGYSVADGPILQSTLLACLELVANEGNDVALLQVVNKPKRGIGQGMIGFLQSLPMSESDHPSLLARMRRAVATDFTLSHVPSASAASSRRPSTKAREGVSSFLTWYDSLKARAFHCRVSELFECVMRQLQYDPSEDWEIDEAIAERIPILNQIVAIEDTEGHILATIDDPLMRIRFVLGHLQIVSVEDDDQLPDGNVQSQADFRRKASKEHVTLTTIHQAKGLEWPFVFIIRANEGVFPVSPAVDVRSAEQAAHMEEERRLAYVAFTRAMEKLYITSAVMDDRGRISRFVWDIPSEHLLVPPNMTVEDLKRHPYKLVTSDRTIGGVRTSVGQPTHESTLGKRNRLMSPESTHTDGIESRGGKMSKWTR
jgi:DNA helicase-2/ATP-dependent DNA helicase PcrA